MGERSKNRDAVERVAARIKAHRDQSGGGLSSSTEAHREAAEVARRRDNERAAGGGVNTRKRDPEQPAPSENAKPGRVFVDLGGKGR